MSRSSQLLKVSLIAAATVCLVIYVNNQSKGATAKSSKKDEDDAEVQKPASSTAKKVKTVDAKKPALDATPKRSNVTDQREIHSKIEELDKKGKALFKSKKVRLENEIMCHCKCFVLPMFVCVFLKMHTISHISAEISFF